MMTENRKFTITKPGEPEGWGNGAYDTVKELEALGIKTSITTIYGIKKGKSKLFRWAAGKMFKNVKVTCLY